MCSHVACELLRCKSQKSDQYAGDSLSAPCSSLQLTLYAYAYVCMRVVTIYTDLDNYLQGRTAISRIKIPCTCTKGCKMPPQLRTASLAQTTLADRQHDNIEDTPNSGKSWKKRSEGALSASCPVCHSFLLSLCQLIIRRSYDTEKFYTGIR